MVKTISKVGNSHGIIFDSALLELAHLKPGDEVNVEVHAGGTITLTPRVHAITAAVLCVVAYFGTARLRTDEVAAASEDAIRRHANEAEVARHGFERLGAGDREALLRFLKTL